MPWRSRLSLLASRLTAKCRTDVTAPAQALLRDDPAPGVPSRRVAYLLGAGATQGAVQFAGSAARLVMPGLIERLLDRAREAYMEGFVDHLGLKHLVNDVVDDDTDFEQLLTFLEDTPSARYQAFAQHLKRVFSTVLRTALDEVRTELGDEHSALYAVLLDMHEVPDSGEQLAGFLTLNYDAFLEHAIERSSRYTIDYGVRVGVPNGDQRPDALPVLKLHGSFGWRHTWPLARIRR
jgi:hypothetical protein